MLKNCTLLTYVLSKIEAAIQRKLEPTQQSLEPLRLMNEVLTAGYETINQQTGGGTVKRQM